MSDGSVGFGGGGGIRTHGTLSRTPVFKTGAFDHSATPPVTCSPSGSQLILKDGMRIEEIRRNAPSAFPNRNRAVTIRTQRSWGPLQNQRQADKSAERATQRAQTDDRHQDHGTGGVVLRRYHSCGMRGWDRNESIPVPRKCGNPRSVGAS